MLSKIKSRKLLCCLIIVVELAVLCIAYFINSRREDFELNYTQEDFVYDTGESGFYLDKSFNYNYISTPEIILPKGWYTLEVNFEYARELTSRLEIQYSDEDFEQNAAYSIPLDGNSISYDFGIKYSGRPVNVRARLSGDAGDGDYILLRNIRIVRAPYAMENAIFNIIALFLLIDMLLLLYVGRNRWNIGIESGSHVIILLLTIFLSSIPLMINYLFDTHDLPFHLMRIEGLAEGLRSGMFPVKIQPAWLNGHGYAVSVFYGDVFLYIPALLRLFGVSIQNAYKFYVLIINAVTVLIAYRAFAKMGGERAGIVCTIVYTLNIYRLCCIYTRGAVGEYTAMAFMPLVLYGLWKAYTLPEDTKEHSRSCSSIMFGCTGIFMSHIISAEITAFFIAITAVILYKRTFSRKTFLVLIKAVVLTVCLNLWFLVPFLDYMTSGTYVINNPDAYAAYKMEDEGIYPAQLFMVDYDVIGGSEDSGSGVHGEMPLTVGCAQLFVLIAWFLLCFGKKGVTKSEKKAEYLAVFLCALSLGMTLCLFPYAWLVSRIPLLKFPIRSFQFPWRFLTMAGLMLSYLLCIIISRDYIEKKMRAVLSGLLIILSIWQGLSYMSMTLNENEVYRPLQAGDISSLYVHGGEYLPIDLDENNSDRDNGDGDTNREAGNLYQDRLVYDKNMLDVNEWHRDNYAVVVSLTNNTSQVQQLEVPLLMYKYYRALSDSGEGLEIAPGGSYRISVSVPAGFSGSFRVEFKEPWYWRLCEVISLITIAVFIVVFFRINWHTKDK